MSNLRDKLYWLGEGLKITSNPNPIIHWNNNSVKVVKLTDNILHLELNIDGNNITKKIPITHDDYIYLTSCLNRFNLD